MTNHKYKLSELFVCTEFIKLDNYLFPSLTIIIKPRSIPVPRTLKASCQNHFPIGSHILTIYTECETNVVKVFIKDILLCRQN